MFCILSNRRPNHLNLRIILSILPFQFYDLDYEVQTPLQINPYQCLDFALLKYQSELDKTEHLKKLIDEVKAVNGTFTAVFHNYTFSDLDRWKGYKSLFNIILESAE